VKVGVWFDLRNPPGWRQDPARLYGFTLDMCAEAERLGVDSVWFSEHHCFEDGYLPQPLTFAAAAAARTTRVRLGTGILIAPLRKTAQLAEEAAVVDIISGGRLDLGLGAGYRVPEFEMFGADMTARYRVLDGQVGELRKLWADGGITPAPVQERLPIWLGYGGPQGARRAGRMGEALLTLSAASWPHYRDGLAEGGHDPASARMAGGVQAYVTDDPDRDWPQVASYIAYQQDTYRRYMVEGTDRPVPRPVDPERLRSREPGASPLSYYLFGTPEQVAAGIREHAAGAPVETVWLWGSVAGMPEDMVARHVETICTRLRPLLAGYQPGPVVSAGQDAAGQGSAGPDGPSQDGPSQDGQSRTVAGRGVADRDPAGQAAGSRGSGE
jgi:alkanesulfonate monooxygenase SsuD/methylene tetrahydromethanopterin reductase-like flavin-dependent oxidoreductase (luciferase family)